MDGSKSETKYISIIVMSVLILIFVICYTMIGNATQSISDMESKKQEDENRLSSVQEQASELSETKDALENIVSGLNDELTQISAKISDIESQINDKTEKLNQTRIELEQAKYDEEKQYNDMKLRIKFMYEMNENSYIDIFMSGANIANSLNKAEYFTQLVKYDRKMLEKYKESKLLKAEKEKGYEEEQQELLGLNAELDEQRKILKEKIDAANEQIMRYAGDIDAAEKAALEYEKKIEEQQLAIDDENRRIEESRIMEIESIERERREKEASERASIEESIRLMREAGQETTSPQEGDNNGENGTGNNDYNININYEIQPKDIDILAAIIQCEADDQTYYGKLCVGAVVMNRINSISFPNTLSEVVYQPYQFSPVLSGRFAIVLARGANATCYQAAREVLEQGNIVGPWLFFRMNDGSRQGVVIGAHVFY